MCYDSVSRQDAQLGTINTGRGGDVSQETCIVLKNLWNLAKFLQGLLYVPESSESETVTLAGWMDIVDRVGMLPLPPHKKYPGIDAG